MSGSDKQILTLVKPGWCVETPHGWIKDYPKVLESAGRTCYKSENRIGNESAEPFIRKVVRLGHESVIEHLTLSVRIWCSRACSHQLVRHRIAAYSQESQRYCDYSSDGLMIVVPEKLLACVPGIMWLFKVPTGLLYAPVDSIKGFDWGYFNEEHTELCCTHPLNLYLDTVWGSYDAYKKLRDLEVPSEDARYLLPNATKTEVFTTFNLRQWRHVFKHRALNVKAQWEIRGIFSSILTKFKELVPCVFDDLEVESDVTPG